MSGICFWYWSTSEQKMTKARRLRRRDRCSSSCSLLEKMLRDPDWEIDETLAEKECKTFITLTFRLITFNLTI